MTPRNNVIYLCRCEPAEDWEWFTIWWCNPNLCSCFCHDPFKEEED